MKKLGQILLDEAWLTVEGLMKGLRHQGEMGGRLGTCLLELKLVSEERLATALSRQFDCEALSPRQLHHVDRELLDALPSRMACSGHVVPFEGYATSISLAMRNPNDLQLQDEASFVLGKRIQVFVAPEVRIKEALQKYYGCDVEMRYERIWDHLNRVQYLWASPEEPRETAPEELPDLPVFEEPDLPVTTELPKPPTEELPHPSSPRERQSTTSESEYLAVSAAPPEEVPELEKRLRGLDDRDEIARTTLAFFAERFERALLFMIRDGRVVGWMGGGDDVDPERLADFDAGFERPSLFLNLRAGSEFYRGPLTETKIHRRLAEIWGGDLPADCLALPVRLRERLVTAIYCDEKGRPLPEFELHEMHAAARATAGGFESLLVRKKQGTA